uniref:Uncharacterized protein n=1 Tax=Caenorhabditis tropicalis TaxID=1561998 RepID=A0A1I7U3Q0_9PELO
MTTSTSSPAIDFYLSEVDSRLSEKQLELEKTLEKSQNVRIHAETIQNFIGKIQMAKLMEKLEKVTEERKQKERTLLKLYEEEGKTLEDSEDEEEDDVVTFETIGKKQSLLKEYP